MRITKHPILVFPEKKSRVYFEGKKVSGYEGDTIASALRSWNYDFKLLNSSEKAAWILLCDR